MKVLFNFFTDISIRRKKTRPFLMSGFTLIETLVAVAIFCLIAVAVYDGFVSVSFLSQASKLKAEALALATEQIEIARNLPYVDVGIESGLPAGKIPHLQNLTRGGRTFLVTTTVRNIDDPFDGTIGGTPNDLSPADYKMVEISIDCENCRNFSSVVSNTIIGPGGLETSSGNGALFVKVFDANGQPVADADVRIENRLRTPNIIIDDVTDKNGLLVVVDVPPGNFAYKIIVSKTGYSSSQTYASGENGLANPAMPNATVAVGQVTQVSLIIDKVSQIKVVSTDTLCQPVGPFNFNLAGDKVLSNDPLILKYQKDLSVDTSGLLNLTGLEWGTYTLLSKDSSYDVAGSFPLFSVPVAPNSVNEITLVLTPKVPKGLLVSVKDAVNGLPLSGVSVQVSGNGDNKTLVTNQGFFNDTDWSTGSFETDGKIEANDPAGELKLKKVFDAYETSGVLVSKIWDTGTASTTFYNLSWTPLDQATSTGAGSVRLQLASSASLSPASWEFSGPDGTASTYYTVSNGNISANHNGQRYLRYKVFLQTSDTNFTPNISDIAITYSSACIPFGQVFFSGLTGGNYDLSASLSGYQSFAGQVNVSNNWQSQEIVLNPE
ncbi:MAG: prepilin-type N-terminal cleavage/methylation domain-containing protein [Candidatus Vogelbacteria bacterium]|nr:prepilin-type N-terminal cleavage/methylation domain-containing protein [Candidatus Vogelbacteria bacterium]